MEGPNFSTLVSNVIRASRLIAGFIAGGVLGAIVVIALQFGVDPYDYFGLPKFEGINAQKPFMYDNARLAKPQAISREKPRGLILGGSTLESGFDPEHPAFKPFGPMYNSALPSGRLYESYRMLQHALARSDIKLAIVSLDFINWIGFREAKAPTFAESEMAVSLDGVPNISADLYPSLNRIFHPGIIGNGLVSLSYQDTRVLRNGTSSDRFPAHWYLKNGQRSHESSLRYGLAHGGFDGPFRRYVQTQFARLKAIDRNDPFPARVSGGNYFDLLGKFVKLSAEHDFKLVFVMPPCHLSILETFHEAGVWQEFRRFKLQVVAQLKDAEKYYHVQVPAYDFCVFEEANAEPIFDRANQMIPPATFWDPVHLNTKNGDVVLAIMFGGLSPDGRYGVNLLASPDIEEHLNRDLLRRQELQGKFPAEFKKLAELFVS